MELSSQRRLLHHHYPTLSSAESSTLASYVYAEYEVGVVGETNTGNFPAPSWRYRQSLSLQFTVFVSFSVFFSTGSTNALVGSAS